MTTTWILETHGNPLETVRSFLGALWEETGLEGMVIPTYQADRPQVFPRLLESQEELRTADPFVPFMPINAAKFVSNLANERPASHLGAVLRPCEARALHQIANCGFLNRDRWLIIGADCLASFPIQEFEWRAQKAGGVEQLSTETLRFPRQGGIAPYRYRSACQTCLPSASQYVDVNLDLIGLPVNQYIFIQIRWKDVARTLMIDHLTDGLAPPELVARRDAALTRLANRHKNTKERMESSLPAELPRQPDDLVAFLRACEPCQKCLEACPIYAGELALGNNGLATAETQRWLCECAQCGMCEQACPRHLALAVIHGLIVKELAHANQW